MCILYQFLKLGKLSDILFVLNFFEQNHFKIMPPLEFYQIKMHGENFQWYFKTSNVTTTTFKDKCNVASEPGVLFEVKMEFWQIVAILVYQK